MVFNTVLKLYITIVFNQFILAISQVFLTIHFKNSALNVRLSFLSRDFKKIENFILKSTRLKFLSPCSSSDQKLSQKNLLHRLLFNHIPAHSGENFDILELYIQMVYNRISAIVQRLYTTIV